MLDLNEVFTSVEVPVSSRNLEFSFQSVQDNGYMKEKIDQRNKLASRLERLITEPRVSGQALVEHILKWCPQASPEELLTVGKALQRVAELLPAWNTINDEVNGLVWTYNNQHKVAMAFADFTAPDPEYFTAQTD